MYSCVANDTQECFKGTSSTVLNSIRAAEDQPSNKRGESSTLTNGL